MKKIAISQRVDFLPKRKEVRDSLDQKLIILISMCNFIPILVPNSLVNDSKNEVNTKLENFLRTLAIEGIILSGGNNIGEEIKRDKTERILLNFALKNKLPLLGICRGMQMIANFAGEKLHHVKGHADTRNQLRGSINREVNSYHDYSISKCPNDFKVIAHSLDGEIEAIKHKSLPWEGWMWHPEREEKFLEEDINRIKNLFL